MAFCLECPACGHRNVADAKFCNACGSPVDLIVCPQCDAINPRDGAYCYNCHGPLAGRTSAEREAPLVAPITFPTETAVDEGNVTASPPRSDPEPAPEALGDGATGPANALGTSLVERVVATTEATSAVPKRRVTTALGLLLVVSAAAAIAVFVSHRQFATSQPVTPVPSAFPITVRPMTEPAMPRQIGPVKDNDLTRRGSPPAETAPAAAKDAAASTAPASSAGPAGENAAATPAPTSSSDSDQSSSENGPAPDVRRATRSPAAPARSTRSTSRAPAAVSTARTAPNAPASQAPANAVSVESALPDRPAPRSAISTIPTGDMPNERGSSALPCTDGVVALGLCQRASAGRGR